MKKTTQNILAEKIGVTQGQISRLLAGKCRPSVETAKRLAELTGTEWWSWIEKPPEWRRRAIRSVQ